MTKQISSRGEYFKNEGEKMENEKLLNLRITKKVDKVLEKNGRSYSYDIQIGDWHLGRGVSDFQLTMPASERPKVVITCYPDVMDIDVDAIFTTL